MRFRAMDFWLAFFVMATPVVSALATLSAVLVSPETIIIFGAIAAMSLFVTAIAGLDPRIAVLIYTGFILGFLDLGFGGNNLLSAIVFVDADAPRLIVKAARVATLMLVFASAAWVSWKNRTHVSTILTVAYGAMFLSSIVMMFTFPNGESTLRFVPSTASSVYRHESFTRADQIWVHLIFDELMAVRALPDELDQTQHLATRFESVFSRHGFRHYEKAYSRHFLSKYSIPEMLNFELSRINLDQRFSENIVAAQKYFDWLTKEGYEIKVFQSDGMHFCPAKLVTECNTYSSFDPREPHLPYSLLQRSFYLIYPGIKTFKDSYMSNYLQLIMARMRVPSRFDVQGFAGWFGEVATAIEGASAGEAIFAHFLMPHAPYILDASCWQVRHGRIPYDLIEQYPTESEFVEARLSLYADYADQVECMLNKLEALFETLAANGKLEGMTFIIHGDHGSRISRSRYFEKMKRQDFIDNYATHFSIRSPGVEAGTDNRQVSIQRLFSEYAGDGAKELEDKDGQDFVLVESEATGDYQMVVMPPF